MAYDRGYPLKRSRRFNANQMKALINEVVKNPSLHQEKLAGPHGRKNQMVKWNAVAIRLNCLGPPKDWKGWRMAWRDLRNRVVRRAQIYASGTDPDAAPLSDTERKVLELTGRLIVEQETDEDDDDESNYENPKEDFSAQVDIKSEPEDEMQEQVLLVTMPDLPPLSPQQEAESTESATPTPPPPQPQPQSTTKIRVNPKLQGTIPVHSASSDTSRACASPPPHRTSPPRRSPPPQYPPSLSGTNEALHAIAACIGRVAAAIRDLAEAVRYQNGHMDPVT